MAKLTTTGTKCGKHGHWRSDYPHDRAIKFNLPSPNTPILKDTQYQNPKANQSHGKLCSAKAARLDNASYTVHSSKRNDEGIDIGPIVDSSASYSTFGFTELLNPALDIAPYWYSQLEPLAALFVNTSYWQYAVSQHASPARTSSQDGIMI